MRSLKVSASIFSLFVLLAAGCGGGEEPSLPPGGGGGGGGPAYDASSATATISGSILFEGTPPEMRPIQTSSDPKCTQPVMTQNVLVTDDGKLENVILYLRSGYDESVTYPVPTESVVIDQHDCHYVPHVFTMMAGQDLIVRNSDDTVHNIHATPQTNAVFNFAQSRQGMENHETFASPEMPVPFQCDVHRWMRAYVGVFDNPFHATSGDTGMYTLRVPPGSYEVVAWHEEYGEMVATVEVGDGETAELNFTYSAG